MEKVRRDTPLRITLSVSHLSNEEIANKLHSQFSHPPSKRLIKLLQYAQKDNPELVDLIKKKSIY